MNDGVSIQSHHRTYVGDFLLESTPLNEENLETMRQRAPELLAKTLDLVARTGTFTDVSQVHQTVLATPWVPYSYATVELHPKHVGDVRYEAVITHEQAPGKLMRLGSMSVRLVGRHADSEPQQSPKVLAVLDSNYALQPTRWGEWRPSGQASAIFDHIREYDVKDILLPRNKAEEAVRQKDIEADRERQRNSKSES